MREICWFLATLPFQAQCTHFHKLTLCQPLLPGNTDVTEESRVRAQSYGWKMLAQQLLCQHKPSQKCGKALFDDCRVCSTIRTACVSLLALQPIPQMLAEVSGVVQRVAGEHFWAGESGTDLGEGHVKWICSILCPIPVMAKPLGSMCQNLEKRLNRALLVCHPIP